MFNIDFTSYSYSEIYFILSLIIFSFCILIYKFLKFRTPKEGILTLLRIVIITSLSFSILNPTTKVEKKITQEIDILVDVSSSTNMRSTEQIVGEITNNFKNLTLNKLFLFAKESFPPLDFTADIFTASKFLDQSQLSETNLLEAIKSISKNGNEKILLLTDGFDTSNSSQTILDEVKKMGIKIFPFYNNNLEFIEPNIEITRLEAPLYVKSQSNVDINITLNNSFGKEEKGQLEVTQGDKVIYKKEVSIPAFSDKLVTVLSDSETNGTQEVRAKFRPLRNDAKETEKIIYLSSEKKDKILLLSGDISDEKYLYKILDNNNYILEKDTSKIKDSKDLENYSVIILNNIHYNQIPAIVQANLSKYVQEGGGFLMIGGNRSFGLGGYLGSRIEEILPVNLIPPQTVQKRLNVAVQLVLDKSRSMADGDRIYFAREAAKEVVRNLKDDDFLGVIGFDSNPFIVQRIEQLADIRYSVMERIDRLYPARRTNLLPAIDEARRGLERVSAGRKHMIILTDGQIPDSSPLYLELVKEIKATGITVSTVLLSDEMDDRLLEQMANKGGGSFYKTSDPTSLPRIFLKDVKVNTGERTMQESEQSFTVGLGEGRLETVNVKNFNNLYGFVETKRRDGANIELVIKKEDKNYPLLASMNFGSGKSVAFTSDANGRWSQNWIPASYFIPFWSQTVEALHQKSNDSPGNNKKIDFDLKYSYENGEAKFDLTVFNEVINNLPSLNLIIDNKVQNANEEKNFSTASQDKLTAICKKQAKGHFLCTAKDPKVGKNIVKIDFGNQQLPDLAINIPNPPSKEIKGKGFNTAFLEELAGVSGGKCNPSEKDLKATEGKFESANNNLNKGTNRSLVPYLFLIALISYFIEVFVRKYKI